MAVKNKPLILAVGTASIISLAYMQLPHSSDEMFIMDDVARDYWLKGGLGLCGAKMKPDIATIKETANKGNTIAAFRLGQLYEDGSWGVVPDLQEATVWFQRAAEGGLYDAQIYMGRAYEQGKGVERNHKKALAWYQKAIKQRTSPFLEQKAQQLATDQ